MAVRERPAHLGHVAGPGVPSDIFARYHRFKGNDVLMVSGTDEHGTPSWFGRPRRRDAARARRPQQRTDPRRLRPPRYDVRLLHADDDAQPLRGRPGHVPDAVRNGFLFEETTLGAFSFATGRTLPDRYIEGTCPICGYGEARGDQCDNCGNQLDPVDLIDPRSIIDGSTPEFRETTHLFLDLPAFREARRVDRDETHWRPNVRNFALNLARELKPRAMTRDIDWGVPVPVEGYPEDDEAHLRLVRRGDRLPLRRDRVGHNAGRPEAWREWWQNPESRSFYFMGKDNITFHTNIWPSTCWYGPYGLQLQLPDNVVSSEYLTMSGSKASTSRRHRSGSRTSSTVMRPTRCATTSPPPDPRPRTATSRGRSSSVARTTSCSRTGETSSTGRS